MHLTEAFDPDLFATLSTWNERNFRRKKRPEGRLAKAKKKTFISSLKPLVCWAKVGLISQIIPRNSNDGGFKEGLELAKVEVASSNLVSRSNSIFIDNTYLSRTLRRVKYS